MNYIYKYINFELNKNDLFNNYNNIVIIITKNNYQKNNIIYIK